MSAPVYQWKPQAQIKIDPQAAGEHLELLRVQSGGDITPGAVVDAARSNNSPLHGGFEWDDSEAAEKYRIEQAKYLLRMIVVAVHKPDENKSTPMRAFVSITRDNKPSFVSLKAAMSDADLRAQIVARAKNELRQWADRYRQYEELATICEAIDKDGE